MAQLIGDDERESLGIELAEVGESLRSSLQRHLSSSRSSSELNPVKDDAQDKDYPNLAQTFLDVGKIQYGKDVGHPIVEAYSRALQNLAFKILTRMGDICQKMF
ncbi:hypothetical protein Vadar_029291 [Vaccinium darrowii]|uniref:Uncharacterized protein n=1 Tax=Vaccinium darrowii TaxID=229202 RepID=A0ACB7X5C4_9ERIC|nr:hypothetical protein Vadar_029291 [Vaccinium darrowii]